MLEPLMIGDLKAALRGLVHGTPSPKQNNGPLFQRVTDIGTDESEGWRNPGNGPVVDPAFAPTSRSMWPNRLSRPTVQEL